jgi:hypothetical protein
VGYYRQVAGVNIVEDRDNWVFGMIGKYYFEAKVYTEPSNFGLYHGRISKLAITPNKDNFGSEAIYHYDRGHNHSTSLGRKLARKFLKVFPRVKDDTRARNN